jgi:hypothetical protein
MCGACACRGRYLQQLPSSLAASARHRKDILVRCRGRLQQLPRMYTGRTSRPRRRTRSSCAVVPSRHNQRCAKPHAVRIPWRTRGAACALGAPGALHALAGRCMRSRRMGAACARGTRGAACACGAPGAACARGAPGWALHALAAHRMRSRRTRLGAACARGTRGAACACGAPGAACARGAPGWALHALAAPGALHALAAHPGRCMRSLYPHGAAATARCGCDRAHCGIRTVLPQSPWDVANVRWR